MIAKARGVSLVCVKKICAEAKWESDAGPSRKIAFKSPRKIYKRPKRMTHFDNEAVRRTVHSFYDNGRFPTSANILVAL